MNPDQNSTVEMSIGHVNRVHGLSEPGSDDGEELQRGVNKVKWNCGI